jgi:hypothetical protein
MTRGTPFGAILKCPARGQGERMNASLLAVLNDTERRLVAETEPDALAALDEDAAIELEARVRRTRDNYVSQYRRGASAAVAGKGGRGAWHARRTPAPPRRPRRSSAPCPGRAGGSRGTGRYA